MDQLMSNVARAVGSGARTIKAVIDATGLSRLKVERALNSLEKQKLLVRDGQGFRAAGTSTPQVQNHVRQCGSCTSCCTLLEVTEVGTAVNEWCKHCEAGKGCTIYDQRPQMCRSFSCAWLQGDVDDDWYPEKAGIVVHFSQDAVNVQVDAAHPDRWRQEPYFSKLSEWSLNGLRMSGGPGYATLVAVGDSEKYLLLGRTIVADPTMFGTAFLPVAHEPSAIGRPLRRSICNGCRNASPKFSGYGKSSATARSLMTMILTRPIGPIFSNYQKFHRPLNSPNEPPRALRNFR